MTSSYNKLSTVEPKNGQTEQRYGLYCNGPDSILRCRTAYIESSFLLDFQKSFQEESA